MATPTDVLKAAEGLDIEALAALPIDDALRAWQVLENAHRCLAAARSDLERLITPAMPAEVIVQGSGVFTKLGRKDRTEWDREALLSAVLDSRLVDPTTGEIADETPLAKVLHVWNLQAPRTLALRARGIDPDEFCRTEWRGYSIRNDVR
jgi:hypothetical protein